MLAAKGVKVPATWDELRAAAAQADGARGRTTSRSTASRCRSTGGSGTRCSTRRAAACSRPTARRPLSGTRAAEALQFWVDMVNKDKTMKRPPGKDYSAWEVANTDFVNQRVGMIFTSTAFLNYMTENAKFKSAPHSCPRKAKAAVPDGRHVLRHDEGRAARPEGSGLGLHQVDDGAGADHLAVEGDRLHARAPVRHQLARDAELLQGQPELQGGARPAQDAQKFPFSPGAHSRSSAR